MYSNTYNNAVLERLKEAQAGLSKLANIPLLYTDEAAQNFADGCVELFKMSKAEREKIESLTSEELKKSDYSKEIKTAVAITSKAISMVSAASMGNALNSEAIEKAIAAEKKSFHTETRSTMERAVLVVDEISSMMQETGIDAGWMLAYRPIAAYGKDEIQVNDVLGLLRFSQLGRNEDAMFTGLGSEKAEKVGYDRFGGGFEYNTYDMPNSAYNLNQVLAGMRVAALQLQAWVAYKNLFRQDAANGEYAVQAWPNAGTDTTTKDKSFNWAANAIHTLNESFRTMKLEATQTRQSPLKKGSETKTQAPLPITAQTSGLVYFNDAHSSLIDSVRRMSGGDDGINPRLLQPFVFIPTMLAPQCGGWRVTDEVDRDDHGAFGVMEEFAQVKKTGAGNPRAIVGARLVIPGLRNLHAMFQDLSFGEETNFVSEKVRIAAYKREKFAVDPRQSAMVKLEAAS